MSEVEEAISRIKSRVDKFVFIGRDGSLIRDVQQGPETIRLTNCVNELVDKARNVVRDVDPANDMTFMRITLRQHEILIAPGKDSRIIALQNISQEREEQRA